MLWLALPPCLEVPKLDFQSEFSMSNIFIIFFSLKNKNLGAHFNTISCTKDLHNYLVYVHTYMINATTVQQWFCINLALICLVYFKTTTLNNYTCIKTWLINDTECWQFFSYMYLHFWIHQYLVFSLEEEQT